MKCGQCRKLLMTSQRPTAPSARVQAHLAACHACRAFQRQLVMVEASVPRVPVIESRAKKRLLEQIAPGEVPVADRGLKTVAPAAAAAAGQPAISGTQSELDLPRLIRRRWLLAAKWGSVAAAALVLIGVGLWVGGKLSRPGTGELARNGEPTKKKPDDPFAKKGEPNLPAVAVNKPLVAQLMDCDLKLAEVVSLRERVAALAEMAAALDREAAQLGKAAPATMTAQLSGLYQRVVDDGVVPLAKKLPAAERPDVAKGVKVKPALFVGGPAVQERVRLLKRDQALIQTLVDGGIKLAAEDDPLKRADLCNRMADKLAVTIKVAVSGNDAEHAAQLGEQMEQMLVQGVAGNLELAREAMEPDSPRQPEIAKMGVDAAGAAKSVEDQIRSLPALDANMQRALQAVIKGNAKVQSAAFAKSGKAKAGKGKKGKQSPQ